HRRHFDGFGPCTDDTKNRQHKAIFISRIRHRNKAERVKSRASTLGIGERPYRGSFSCNAGDNVPPLFRHDLVKDSLVQDSQDVSLRLASAKCAGEAECAVLYVRKWGKKLLHVGK